MSPLELPRDRVEIPAGICHLPAVLRDIARLANQAGLKGFEVADVDVGLDAEAARRYELRSYAWITYRHAERPEGAVHE